MLAQCDLATARIHAGDIVGACGPLRQAQELSDTVRSPRVSAYLDATLARVRGAQCGDPAVRDVLARAGL